MEPIVVEFPLRGEWNAYNTPGHTVPSHGTDNLGQTYAYDFIQRDWSIKDTIRWSTKPRVRSLLFGERLKDCIAWSKPYFAPFSGEVVEAEDGVDERDPVHFARDLFVAIRNGRNESKFKRAKRNSDLKYLLGNYIILKHDSYFALFAHSRRGSISVSTGDQIAAGQKLAEVGHSGNSTGPHLHFQLMDDPNLLVAKGLPCCFREYELYEGNLWQRVSNGIPTRKDRVRVLDA